MQNLRNGLGALKTAKPVIRLMKESDYTCLPEFLYQAVFVPKGMKPPPRNLISEPEIDIYINGFGTKIGDLGVVAEQEKQIVGAAWARIIPAYGHINDDTPELAVSLLPEFRGLGIGTRLIMKLFDVMAENGYAQISLSVQQDNPAVRLYKRLGFEITEERLDFAGNEDFIMLKQFN